ncbi:cupin domain-containing protein [Algivirga pacifica]|uniref:Cupin domain-containing protein n=1 Tax=Algivirga pacifica TaxID=1162670 RepID=A0ABP9D5D5_9BACT
MSEKKSLSTSIAALVNRLNLQPHPEGGYYREIYRSALQLPQAVLPNFNGNRAASTAIYYLLDGEAYSSFHKIKSDEAWHFYAGTTVLEVYELKVNGELLVHQLSNDPDQGDFFAVVEAGSWFAARLKNRGKEDYALVGCTVAPGFDFEDFELAAKDLIEEYPQYEALIRELL